MSTTLVIFIFIVVVIVTIFSETRTDPLKDSSWQDPVNIMSLYWLNNTCSPFDTNVGDCKLGNLAPYAVDVDSAETAMAGIKFAREHNLRLTVKITGHDLLGRSSGRGALELWTHNLKSIRFSDYRSAGYTGPAATLGAGVQAFEAYEAAHRKGLRVVGGSCPTVGLAAGFVQGGGHGPEEARHHARRLPDGGEPGLLRARTPSWRPSSRSTTRSTCSG
ncbi:fad binding domain protein [Apiospora saccharicola]|uniref:Fad binding domain protein n=1 Tax=Apiospora saccharicola TaxID=335842 RepID=A0ABR1UNQ8_9PEZI